MFCVHCGKQINDTATFCGYCGGKVGLAQATSEPRKPTGKKKSKTKVVVAIICIIFVLASAAAGLLLFKPWENFMSEEETLSFDDSPIPVEAEPTPELTPAPTAEPTPTTEPEPEQDGLDEEDLSKLTEFVERVSGRRYERFPIFNDINDVELARVLMHVPFTWDSREIPEGLEEVAGNWEEVDPSVGIGYSAHSVDMYLKENLNPYFSIESYGLTNLSEEYFNPYTSLYDLGYTAPVYFLWDNEKEAILRGTGNSSEASFLARGWHALYITKAYRLDNQYFIHAKRLEGDYWAEDIVVDEPRPGAWDYKKYYNGLEPYWSYEDYIEKLESEILWGDWLLKEPHLNEDLVHVFEKNDNGIFNLIAIQYDGDTPTPEHSRALDENGIFAAGVGTQEDPFVIITVAQFYNIRDYLDSSFVLGDDIDFENKEFEAIGSGAYSSGKWSADNGFNGSLDGNGYRISGVSIESNFQCCGIFRSIGSNGAVRNLNVSGTARTLKNDPNNAIGIVAGYNEGTIENCRVSVSVEGSGTYAMVGGLVGTNNGLIKSCVSDGSIQGFGQYVKTGGISGLNLDNGHIDACSSSASILSEYKSEEITGWNEGRIS